MGHSLCWATRYTITLPIKELDIVDESLWSDIIIPTTTAIVTLVYAAKEASTSIRVGISCQCKGNCNSKRCKCHKEGRQCIIHCHQDDHDCGNLSELTTRIEIALVERPRRKRARADTIGNRGQSRTARANGEWKYSWVARASRERPGPFANGSCSRAARNIYNNFSA